MMNVKDRVIWEISPKGSANVYNSPPITYGKIPAGFKQSIPEKGEPPPLLEGRRYQAGGPSSGANMEVFYFHIRNGQAVPGWQPKTH
jgi:hypothetical protein